MLTVAEVKAAKPGDKPKKLGDGRGLFLLVDPKGGKLWRFRYRFGGKEKMLSLGAYPEISLKQARDRREELRRQIAEGLDPSAVRKAEKARQERTTDSFEKVAREYFALHSRKLSESTRTRDMRILNKLIMQIGSRPLADIEAPELLAALRSIESTGAHETAHRALGLAARIYEYALAVGKATRDASSGLGKGLAPRVTKNRPAITDPKKLATMLTACDNYDGQPATVAALRLLPILFVRPGELRQAKWSEFDLDGGQWVVPAARMKSRQEHIVPLPRQAVEILAELELLTGPRDEKDDPFVFPALRPGRPLSENTINNALRNLGYAGDQHVAHGFRTTASTLLHEMGWDSQLIELQLAHSDRNKVRAAYNRSERLPDRRKMMAAWADYLDGIKADNSSRVTALRA